MTMRLRSILIGGGGHARVLQDIAGTSNELEILGYTDTAPGTLKDLPYLGNDDILAAYDPKEILLINGVGSVERPVRRCKVYLHLSQKGYRFATIVQPGAVVSPNARLDSGIQVIGAAVIQSGSVIHENCLINTSAVIDHDCMIGPHTHIATGAVVTGSVKIGRACHIGAGTVIIQGITIGDNVLIGAGSLVLSDIPTGATAYGSPARIISHT